MKALFILLLIFFNYNLKSQDSILRYNKKAFRVKTNFARLFFMDANANFEYNFNNNNIGIGIGYNFDKYYKKNNVNVDTGLPEKQADGLIDVTAFTNFTGPHFFINYKVYTENYLLSTKNFWNFDLYYMRNNYDSICIYYGSNGINMTKRQLIKEKGDFFGVRILRGKEIEVSDYIFFEFYFGFGLVMKVIERNTVSEGYYGGYKDVQVNEISDRVKLRPTLHFGAKLGFQFIKKSDKI